MRTIAQALKDEIEYPLKDGKIENKLMGRRLDGNEEMTVEIYNSPMFKGAVADCLVSLIEAPNLSESDISISLSDRKLILKMANSIYTAIGEVDKILDEPTVYIGQP